MRMTLYPSGPRGTSVHPRVALMSIVAFWLVYFTVATIRSLIVGYGHQVDMLAARGFVSIGSMVATYIVYLAMRPLASKSLGVNMTAIALLAIPASIAYSSMNMTAFKQIEHRISAEKESAKKKVVIRTAEDAERLRDQAEAMREAARQIKEQAREAALSARERIRDQQQIARDAAQAARESAQDARQSVRDAVAEARRHGVNLDENAILARIPPTPPVAPAPMVTPDPVVIQTPAPAMMIQVGQSSGSDHEMELSIAAQIADQAMNGYFFFVAWGAVFLALSYAGAVRAAEREAASYRAAARDAELRALRYQVNPHFLFNTLNSLSTLILKDNRDKAEEMILNLATFFRTSLTADPTEDVLLAEEIRLQRLYLDIEAVRFPERLIVNIVIPPSLLTACVPCLILQPLVENAIKYGVSRAKRPVSVFITAREDSHGLVLTVEDDGDPMEDSEASTGTGVGLKNVTNRLKARFGEDAACRYGPLANGGFGVTLFMPLLRNGC